MEWKNENASERETKQSRKREGSIVEDTRIKKKIWSEKNDQGEGEKTKKRCRG